MRNVQREGLEEYKSQKKHLQGPQNIFKTNNMKSSFQPKVHYNGNELQDHAVNHIFRDAYKGSNVKYVVRCYRASPIIIPYISLCAPVFRYNKWCMIMLRKKFKQKRQARWPGVLNSSFKAYIKCIVLYESRSEMI